MLDLNLIREQPDLVRQAMQSRQMDPAPVDAVLALDEQRRALIQEVEVLKAERNAVSKDIGKMKDPAERQAKIDAHAPGRRPHRRPGRAPAPGGGGAERRPVGHPQPARPAHAAGAQRRRQRGAAHGRADSRVRFRAQAALGPGTGAGDYQLRAGRQDHRLALLRAQRGGARLQRALIAYMLDLHTRQGYTEKYPPFMVKAETLYGAGQLPKFAENLYHDHEEDLWMVPTAEVPLTGLHMNEILEEASLPRLYTAYTPCFRREKMSAGRDVRGIKRGHQFDKVEMYIFCKPEQSNELLEKMREDAEQTVRDLGLTYRVKQLCTGRHRLRLGDHL